MDLLEIGRILGELEGAALSIDEGTLITKKNNTNLKAKSRILNLVKDLKNELSKEKSSQGLPSQKSQ